MFVRGGAPIGRWEVGPKNWWEVGLGRLEVDTKNGGRCEVGPANRQELGGGPLK